MPTQYETCFAIRSAGDATGVRLLKDVTERILVELRSTSDAPTSNEGAPDLETGETANAGYARISAERVHPLHPEVRVRLEVSLCTNGDNLEAEFRSFFLAAPGVEPSNLSPGPPRLLQAITREFHCAIDHDSVTNDPVRVTGDEAESFAAEFILNPQRRLPILAVSEGRLGNSMVDPAAAQRTLLGVAIVASYDKDAANIMSQFVGKRLACYGGAIRMFWPGCKVNANERGPRIFYMPGKIQAKGASLLREMQQACIDGAPESDFDHLFSAARTGIILERNRQLETQQHQRSEESPGDTTELGNIRRELRKEQIAAREATRKWKSALAQVAKLEQELSEEKDRNENLYILQEEQAIELQPSNDRREGRRNLRAANKELRKKNQEQANTIARINEDNQFLRQELERMRVLETTPYEIRMDFPHPGNVTILNYALNLYRDPMRRFILDHLQADDEEGQKEILSYSIQFDFSRDALQSPASLIDVNDFHNVVSDNSPYFPNSRNLAQTLRDIKDIRNKAAHPPLGGVAAEFTQYGLRRIDEALKVIGAKHEQREVGSLIDRIEAN